MGKPERLVRKRLLIDIREKAVQELELLKEQAKDRVKTADLHKQIHRKAKKIARATTTEQWKHAELWYIWPNGSRARWSWFGLARGRAVRDVAKYRSFDYIRRQSESCVISVSSHGQVFVEAIFRHRRDHYRPRPKTFHLSLRQLDGRLRYGRGLKRHRANHSLPATKDVAKLLVDVTVS